MKPLGKIVIALFILVFGVTAIFAGGTAESGETTTTTVKSEGGYGESPMLKELVSSGKLPPVDERLPVDPFVVGPDILVPEEYLDFEVGKHGGEFRIAHISWVNEALFMLEPLLRPNNPIGSKGARPALLSDFSISDDNKDFILTIREGIRWSDGQPLTTEDIRFLFEDVFENPDSKVSWPSNLRTLGRPDGAPPEWSIVDNYTFTLSYDEPYGYLVAGLSSWIWGYRVILQPSGYLKQFHADYTPLSQIESQFKENMKEWGDLFATKVLSVWSFIVDPVSLGVPVLSAFYPKENTQEYILYERNPYFWMVDTAGNQLPYFDSVRSTKMNDMEAVKLRVLSGNVDFALYPALRDIALYIDNKERGDYTILECFTINNAPALTINHDYEYDSPDSAWQSIISDDMKRYNFGTALALAIDHEDVNKTLYFGKNGLPTNTPAEYNPDKAKQLLDEMGMDKIDDEGFRLAPNGERFDFAITQTIWGGDPDLVPTAELLRGYFEQIGVRTTIKTVQTELWDQLAGANKLMACVIWADEPMWPGGISRDYQPQAKGRWAEQSWNYWQSKGASGRTPPAYLQEFWELDMARNELAPGSPEGEAAYERLMQWNSRNYARIFPTQKLAAIRIFSNRLGNVPHKNLPLPWDRIDYTFTHLYIK